MRIWHVDIEGLMQGIQGNAGLPLKKFLVAARVDRRGIGVGPLQAILAGSILALLSAAVNNLPATLISVLVLGRAGHANLLAIYAIILGVDIGPKLTPFGSLATLLWLGILDHNGIHISWGKYFRENWWVALLALGAAFAGLLASNALLQ